MGHLTSMGTNTLVRFIVIARFRRLICSQKCLFTEAGFVFQGRDRTSLVDSHPSL